MKLTGTGLIDDLPHLQEDAFTKEFYLNTVDNVSKGYVYTTAQYTNNNLKATEL